MTDTLNSDLMLAILAMDAYNRGYNASIDLDKIKQIGLATVASDSSDKFAVDPTRASGFYAVEYTWNGKTVISYRGTDNQSVFAKPDKGASDIWSGWTMGAGYAGTSQAVWAEKFYQEVAGQSIYADSAPSNVLLTGHSLGGGLAGYIAALARSVARATWRGGRALLRVAAIAAAVLLQCELAHAQDGTLETKNSSSPATAETGRASIRWFSRQRPQHGDFVWPDGGPCAAVEVTAMKPVGTMERRVGGAIVLDVHLRLEEDSEILGLSRSQVIRGIFSSKIFPGFSERLRNIPEYLKSKDNILQPDYVTRSRIFCPESKCNDKDMVLESNNSAFIVLCKNKNYYMIMYDIVNN